MHRAARPKQGEAVRETDLYAPIKAFLETQGYDVKAEVASADIVALRGDEEPVIVEMKTTFSLSLVHQAVARLSISDLVYIAAPRKSGRTAWSNLKSMKKLCRRLGIGLLTVRMKDLCVEVHCEPAPIVPRKSKVRKTRLLREFSHLSGDPNTGGSTRQGLTTAYRQDALRCAGYLRDNGASKGFLVARASGVNTATRLMADNHYGWFCRVEKGVYMLSEEGLEAIRDETIPPPIVALKAAE